MWSLREHVHWIQNRPERNRTIRPKPNSVAPIMDAIITDLKWYQEVFASSAQSSVSKNPSMKISYKRLFIEPKIDSKRFHALRLFVVEMFDSHDLHNTFDSNCSKEIGSVGTILLNTIVVVAAR